MGSLRLPKSSFRQPEQVFQTLERSEKLLI